jgi:hypothetical protein
MTVGTARDAATDWIMRHGNRLDEFRGAYLIGSTVGLADDAALPTGSDVDVMVVTAGAEPRDKPGKFLHRGTLLEVTYLPWDAIASVERVLGSYHLAAGLRRDTIIADPSGRLRRLQAAVSRHFAEKLWVRRRCEGARRRIEDGLQSIDPSAPWPDQVTSWLFATGVTTHVLLVAALRNPTVRLRYLAARRVLAECGHLDLYPDLLGLLGCAAWDRELAGRHLDALADTFDTAAAVARTPFFFSSDITPAARPIAIDAGRELIRAGQHREAVFWMVATFARCHKILAADAPAGTRHALAPAFDRILADLGIASTDDLLARGGSVREFMPALWSAAEAIVATPLRAGDADAWSR